MNIISLIESDLIQAKILKEENNFTIFNFIKFFLKSRTCRISTFIRLRRSENRLVSYIAKKYLATFFIEIGKNTRIGKYFYLPHPRCIIIADRVEIGEHVHVGQYVTIGGNFKKLRKMDDGIILKLPKIGSRVMIHPSAVIGGPIIIDDDVIVGANSTVTKDIPSNSIVFGQNQLANKKISIPPEGGSYIVIEGER